MISPNAWQRLAAAARRATDDRDLSAPYGFAARVAAQAMACEERTVSIFDQFSLKFSLRVMGVACLLAMVATGASYSTLARLFSDHALPAIAFSSITPSASPAAPEAPAVGYPSPDPSEATVPSSEAPAVNAASPDDPVAEVVNIVS